MQHDDSLPARFSFLLVGVWWWGFGVSLLPGCPKACPCIPENPNMCSAMATRNCKKSGTSSGNCRCFAAILALSSLQYGRANSDAGRYPVWQKRVEYSYDQSYRGHTYYTTGGHSRFLPHCKVVGQDRKLQGADANGVRLGSSSVYSVILCRAMVFTNSTVWPPW